MISDTRSSSDDDKQNTTEVGEGGQEERKSMDGEHSEQNRTTNSSIDQLNSPQAAKSPANQEEEPKQQQGKGQDSQELRPQQKKRKLDTSDEGGEAKNEADKKISYDCMNAASYRQHVQNKLRNLSEQVDHYCSKCNELVDSNIRLARSNNELIEQNKLIRGFLEFNNVNVQDCPGNTARASNPHPQQQGMEEPTQRLDRARQNQNNHEDSSDASSIIPSARNLLNMIRSAFPGNDEISRLIENQQLSVDENLSVTLFLLSQLIQNMHGKLKQK